MHQKTGSPSFAESTWQYSFTSRYLCTKTWLYGVHKWTNVGVYTEVAERNMIQKRKQKSLDWLLIGVSKPKNESVLQLLSQGDGCSLVNKTEPSEWPGSCSDDAAARRRTGSYDQLRLISNVLETWTQHLRDRHVPGLFKIFDKQSVAFEACSPFELSASSKPGKYGVQSWICWLSSY